MTPGDDALRERIAQAERRLAQAEKARGKIWDKTNEQNANLAVVQNQLSNLKSLIADIKNDCATTREWVEDQMKERKAEEAEKQRLSKGQWAAVLVAATTIISSLIAAVAGLASAGVI